VIRLPVTGGVRLLDEVLSLFMQRRRQTETVERLTVATEAEARTERGC
jgi:hypothetical protein